MPVGNIRPIKTNPLPPHPLQTRQSQNSTSTSQFISGTGRGDMSGDEDGNRGIRDIDRDAIPILALGECRLGGGVGMGERADSGDDGRGALLHCVQSA